MYMDWSWQRPTQKSERNREKKMKHKIIGEDWTTDQPVILGSGQWCNLPGKAFVKTHYRCVLSHLTTTGNFSQNRLKSLFLLLLFRGMDGCMGDWRVLRRQQFSDGGTFNELIWLRVNLNCVFFCTVFSFNLLRTIQSGYFDSVTGERIWWWMRVKKPEYKRRKKNWRKKEMETCAKKCRSEKLEWAKHTEETMKKNRSIFSKVEPK